MAGHGKSSQRDARGARLRAALRENLKRRKTQAKARSVTRSADENMERPRDSAAIAPDRSKV
jgi:hypothetical protein